MNNILATRAFGIANSIFILIMSIGCSAPPHENTFDKKRDTFISVCTTLESQPQGETQCYDGCTLYSFYKGRELIGSFCDYSISPTKECKTIFFFQDAPVQCREFYKKIDDVDQKCSHCIHFSAVDT